ncbi:MAG: aspartyl/asparaginyl beta-hydroxylase domain-containing protein [Sphingomonadales bacterium]
MSQAGDIATERLRALATESYQAGRFDEAAGHLKAFLELAPGDGEAALALALAEEQAGRAAEALATLGELIAKQPSNGLAAFHLAGLYAALGETGMAARFFQKAFDLKPGLARAAEHPGSSTLIHERAKVGRRIIADHMEKLHLSAVETSRQRFPEADFSRVSRALWCKYQLQPVTYLTPGQQPFGFYVPNLGKRAWYERAEFDWVPALEAQTRAIAEEAAAGLGDLALAKPYISERLQGVDLWKGLAGSKDWSAVHLYNSGRPELEALKLFPRTIEALEQVPLFRLDGRPLEVLFSILHPETHIPAHYGMSNSRLTVHLPLVVPEECSVTVNGERRSARQGECLLFDDSYLHEAENASPEVRVVLIFEIAHPELSPAELLAVEESIRANDKWLSEAMSAGLEQGWPPAS